MAVSVITLWLIYVLVILVVAIVLCIPNLGIKHHSLVAILFATIVAAVVAFLVPINLDTDSAAMSYNMLLVVAFILPVILIIVIAASGMHHSPMYKADHQKESVKTKMTCDNGEDGEPENCQLDLMTLRKGSDKIKVSFRK